MTEVITIVVPIHGKTATADALRKKLLALADSTTGEAGNIAYRIHEVTGKVGEFMIYEQWKNQAALDFHMQQPYLNDFLNDPDKLLASEVQGTICTQL